MDLRIFCPSFLHSSNKVVGKKRKRPGRAGQGQLRRASPQVTRSESSFLSSSYTEGYGVEVVSGPVPGGRARAPVGDVGNKK